MAVANRGRNIARHVRDNTALWGEAIAMFEKGEYALAEKTFSSMDYVTSAVLFNAGTCSLSQGDVEKAIETYTETLKRDKHFVMAYSQRALAFHIYGWHEDALRDLHEAHRRMRSNRFIEYTNLGLNYVMWECQILANIAVLYVSLGLQRHALHYVEQARRSLEDSFNDRPGHDTQELLEAALPEEVISDFLGYCERTECHEDKTCAFIQLDPQPIFKPRGLSSLWLHASHRIKKDFMGKAKVLYCLGSHNEAGFEGAKAKAAGRPLPLKSAEERAAGGPLALAFNKTLKKRRGLGEPRNHRANSDVGPGTDTAKRQSGNAGMRGERSQSNPGTTLEKNSSSANSLKVKARNATIKSKRPSVLSSVSERSSENSTLQSQRGARRAAAAASTLTGSVKGTLLAADTLAGSSPPPAMLMDSTPIYDDIDDELFDDEDVAGNEEREDEQEKEQEAGQESREVVELSPTEEAALTALQLLSGQLVSKQRNSLGNQAAITALLKAITEITTHLQGEPSDATSSRGSSSATSPTPSFSTSELSKLTIGERSTDSFPLPQSPLATDTDFDFDDDVNIYQYHETLLREPADAEPLYENHQADGNPEAQPDAEDASCPLYETPADEAVDCIYMNCLSAGSTPEESSRSTSSRSSSSTIITMGAAGGRTAAEDAPGLFQLTKNSFVKQVDKDVIQQSPVSPKENITLLANGYYSAPEGRPLSPSVSTSRRAMSTQKRNEELAVASCDEQRGRRRLSSAFDVIEGDVSGCKARLKAKKAAKQVAAVALPGTRNSIPGRTVTHGTSTAQGAQLTAAQRIATLQRPASTTTSSSSSLMSSHYVNVKPETDTESEAFDDSLYASIAPLSPEVTARHHSSSDASTSAKPGKKVKKKPPKKPERPASLNTTSAGDIMSPSPSGSDTDRSKRSAPTVAPRAKPARPAQQPLMPRNSKSHSPPAARPNGALVSACLDSPDVSSPRRNSSASSSTGRSSKQQRQPQALRPGIGASPRQDAVDDSGTSSGRTRTSSVTSICSAFELPSESLMRSQRSRANSSSIESDISGARTRVTSLSSAYETDASHVPGGYRRQRKVSFSDSPPPQLSRGRLERQSGSGASGVSPPDRHAMTSDADTDVDAIFDEEKYGLPAAKVAAITRWRQAQPKPASSRPMSPMEVAGRKENIREQMHGPAARHKSSDRAPRAVDCSS